MQFFSKQQISGILDGIFDVVSKSEDSRFDCIDASSRPVESANDEYEYEFIQWHDDINGRPLGKIRLKLVIKIEQDYDDLRG